MSQGGSGENCNIACATRDVGELLSGMHAQEKIEYRQCFLKILPNLRFVARQGCAIRGQGDETDGNVYQLLKLRGEDHKMVRASNEL